MNGKAEGGGCVDGEGGSVLYIENRRYNTLIYGSLRGVDCTARTFRERGLRGGV